MFSSLKNYSKNIDQSERFYYDNYDYYNIYENIEKDYRDDLSKFTYHCTRRTTPLITTYSKYNQRFKHSRVLKTNQNQWKNMQDFVNQILKVYVQNNYCIPSQNYQRGAPVQPFLLQYMSPVTDIRYQKYSPYQMFLLNSEELIGCLGMIIQKNEQKLKILQDQYAQDDGHQSVKVSTVQFHYALQLYSQRMLKHYYTNQQPINQNYLLLLFQFVVQVHRIMWQILNARTRTVLLTAQPKISPLSLILHPLMLPITTFLKYSPSDITAQTAKQSPNLYKLIALSQQEQKQKSNKIIFINLDGRQTAHNLRCINTMDAEMMYISLFDEPNWIQRKETQMENLYTSYQDGFQVNYANLWEIYSQAIIKQYKQIVDNSKSKILLFPLNSSYIRKTYLQSYFQSSPSSSNSTSKSSPLSFSSSSTLQTSQQIHLLFQQILYEQIRNYKPTIIFISYNGQLNIIEQHFIDIIRNCSIVADHRVVLFTNFVHFFKQENHIYVSQDDQHGEKLLCADQFYRKYMEYKFSEINQQRLYSNMCLFLKYGSGFYSMQDRIIGNPSMRTTIHKLYSYLQTLSSIPQFSSSSSSLNPNISPISNNTLHKWSSSQLQSLYSSYIKWQLKQNKKDNKYYQGLLNTVINQFICKNITQSQLQRVLGKKLIMRYRWIVEQIGREYWEYCHYGRENNRKISIGRDGKGGSKGGSKEKQSQGMQDQEYQEIENQNYGNIWGSQAGIKLLEDYFQNQKEKLLTQNLQNYKIKKFFYLPQNQKSFGQVNCFKFILQIDNKQSQQIYLQKYSQIITNELYQQLFILNHKTSDNRHIFLHGSIKNSQIQKQILVTQIKQTEQQMNQQIKASFQQIYLDEEGLINQKQDIIFVQYNYCIYQRTLYLFWPLLWNLKQQARYKLLGLDYKPKRVNKMIKVFQYQNQLQFRFQNLLFQPSSVPVLPRWGCTCYATSNIDFKIFGGIYDNENDFKMIGSGISIAHIKDNGKYKVFKIQSLPKTKGLSPNKQPITCLRPKINYTIRSTQQKTDHHQQQCIRLSGGYGRDFTGFFNMFSYDQYDLFNNNNNNMNNNNNNNNGLALQKVFDGNKINRRVVITERHLEYQKIGKFNVIINNYNVSQIQEKFSDGLKDKFIFQKRIQSSNKTLQWQLQAFIDQTYRVNEFKTDPKKIFLFGFNRTVRQKIYLKCWSPQLYILDGIKNYIVNLSLKTQKTSSYVITNYLMPREQDIVSLCLQQDKLYLLSNSPIIHSIDRAGLKFVLYQGSLTNINEIIRKKQIQMITKHNFSQQCQKYLSQKSMFVFQEKIFLIGGICSQYQSMTSTKIIHQREDYILELNKNRFKIKIRKLESNQVNLDMPNSVVVKQSQYFYNYSIVFQNQPTQQDQKQSIQWKIKIQKFSYENNESSKIKIGGFKTYIHKSSNPNLSNTAQLSSHIIQKYSHSNIDQPKFVKILPYKRFNITQVRQIIAKIVWRIDKNQQIQNNLEIIIKLYHNENNDKQLMKILQKQWNNYQELFYSVKKRLQSATEINFQQEQLLKDLKILYELIFKMILQKHLYLPSITPIQSSQTNQYLFIAEDKSSRKSKYMAVGSLYTTKLNFFKFRFKNQLLINLNQTLQDQNILFYHPTVLGYYKFQYDQNKSLIMNNNTGEFVEWGAEELLKNVNVSIKQ